MAGAFSFSPIFSFKPCANRLGVKMSATAPTNVRISAGSLAVKPPAHPTYDLKGVIQLALSEDAGDRGDVTCKATIPVEMEVEAHFLAKEDGIVAGISLAEMAFNEVDPSLKVEWYRKDGDTVHKGLQFGKVHGRAHSIVVAERVVLNFMQRMSGIATLTKHISMLFLRSVWNVKIGSFLKRSLSSVSGRESVRDLASKDGELRVFIVAGEVSGDIIASRFMNSLTCISPFPVRFAGVGGSEMTRHGLNSLFPMEDIAVMGIWELLPHLSMLRVKLKETIESALTFHPHIVLTVDSKGFCFRFLKQLRARYGPHKLSCPLHFHYVAPSFWAWKGGESRLKGLSEFVDHVFCILPFEAEVCRSNGLAATFVGHPTLEEVLELEITKCLDGELKVQGDGEKFRRNYGIASESTIISVLPGSRLQEVTRMLSIFSHTMELLKYTFSELTTVIHVAPNKHVEEYIRNAVRQWPVPAILVPGGSPCMKYNSFSASRVALCTSGTVAVELQLARLPCVVAYRAHILTEWFIRYKAKIPYISLPNIVLDSDIIPEALFEACTPSRLAPLLMDLIHDVSLREKQVSATGKFLSLLDPVKRENGNSNQREPTPSMIVALAVLNSERIY